MLTLDIPSAKYEMVGSWDGRRKKLMTVPPIHLEMEHSLLSISRWESKWKIPFIENRQMTTEQFLDYCRCMTINKQKDPEIYRFLRQKDAEKIGAYIDDPMTARRLNTRRKKNNPTAVLTSEYFYFIMIQLGIPFECEKWHFGRLLALIDCCQSNNGSQPPMSYRDRQQFYAELNAKRRKAWGSKG